MERRETNRILRHDLDHILFGPHGGVYLDTAETVTVTDQTTFFIMGGSTTLLSGGRDFDMPQDGRLRYTGKTNRLFIVRLACSLAPVAAVQSVHIRVMKNGTSVVHSENHEEAGGGVTHSGLPMLAKVTLGENEYVELGIRNETAAGADNVSVEHMVMLVDANPSLASGVTVS